MREIICFDAETFFCSKSGYTLKKMTQEAYIRDKRFELHGASIKWSAQHAARWYTARQLDQIIRDQDWSNTTILCHHAQFDLLILSHYYGVKPRMILDTLSMARLLLGNHLSVGLGNLAKHFNLQAKDVPYDLFDGRHWHELTPQAQERVAEGCCHDVELTWQLFTILMKDFPASEYEVVDLTVRMFTEPVLRADVDLLARVWTEEETRKAGMKAALGVTEAQLQSADQFAALLRAEGVEPATKNGKNGEIYAFAKTDEFMRELLDDEDDRVRGLAEARLGVKSTLKQTRAETLGFMAQRGALAVYLRYCAAHTTRWGGGDGANWQNNVPEINAAIVAPDGCLLGQADASQIECRILNYLAGQEDVIAAFRAGRDVYAEQASRFYGRTITKKTDYNERQMFRIVELQAGYGSGAAKIKATIRNKEGIVITDEQADQLKEAYRGEHQAVTGFWREGGNALSWIAGGLERAWGPVQIRDRKMILPNGAAVNYETLEWHVDPETGEDGWRLRTRRGWSRMYGAKLVENLVQALARVAVSQAMMRIRNAGFHVFNMRHDDVGVLIKDDAHAAEALEFCRREMCREVDWLPGCPLGAEATMGQRYAK